MWESIIFNVNSLIRAAVIVGISSAQPGFADSENDSGDAVQTKTIFVNVFDRIEYIGGNVAPGHYQRFWSWDAAKTLLGSIRDDKAAPGSLAHAYQDITSNGVVVQDISGTCDLNGET